MSNKTLRMYFKVLKPTDVTVSGGVASVTKTFAEADTTGAAYIDVVVDAVDATKETAGNLVTTSFDFTTTAGTVHLVKIGQNYAPSVSGTPGDISDATIQDDNICMIQEQPTVNGEVDLLRYDIAGHIPKGGVLAQGELPIHVDETVSAVIGYSPYLTAAMAVAADPQS
jgi:hypothetical protein